MEYLDRDVTLLKQSLEQEENLRLQSENKCHDLVQNQRQLISKYVFISAHLHIYMIA